MRQGGGCRLVRDVAYGPANVRNKKEPERTLLWGYPNLRGVGSISSEQRLNMGYHYLSVCSCLAWLLRMARYLRRLPGAVKALAVVWTRLLSFASHRFSVRRT